MLNLPSTTSFIQVVSAGGAVNLAVHASWADLVSGTTVTPDCLNTNIAAAGTNVVAPAPAASTDRNVKFLSVYNSGAACVVTIEHVLGVQVIELFSLNLLPNYVIHYNTDGDSFVVYDDTGHRLET